MQQQQQPPTLNSAPQFPSSTITTEQIQKYLDENRSLILAIMENQNLGKLAECAQYQALLQKNLMYLAAIADAQPQPSTPSQMPPNSVAQQGNFMQQPQPVTPQQQQQSGGIGGGGSIGGGSGSGGGPKLPFQLNSLRPQDQQQFLHIQQQQQQQQMQGQMGVRPGSNNGMHHQAMHQAMQQPGLVTLGNLTDMRGGGKQDVSEVASGDGQAKPGSARSGPNRD